VKMRRGEGGTKMRVTSPRAFFFRRARPHVFNNYKLNYRALLFSTLVLGKENTHHWRVSQQRQLGAFPDAAPAASVCVGRD